MHDSYTKLRWQTAKGSKYHIVDSNGETIARLRSNQEYRTGTEDEANTNRIIDCVNCLKGVDNPQEFMGRVKELLSVIVNEEWYEEELARDLYSELLKCQ
jgi:hypothetical protein